MSWDCRISWKGHTPKVPTIQSLVRNLLLVTFLYALTNAQIFFTCTDIRDCSCLRPDAKTFEISCPKHTGLEDIAIDKIVAEVQPVTKSVKFKCDITTPEFEWHLLHELNLNKTIRGFPISQLAIENCNNTVPKNTSVAELFKYFEMDPGDLEFLRYTSWYQLPNGTDSFPDYMFPPMPNLKFLNIGSNYLRSLPNLSYFPNLKTLDAKSNKIENITKSQFSLNLKIEQVLLPYNVIASIEDQSFPDGLTELNLSVNKITRVTNDTFSNLKNLKTLYLSSNEFQDFSPHALLGLTSLTHLRMDATKLKFYPVLDNLPSLQYFGMSYNAPRFARNTANNNVIPPPSIMSIPTEPTTLRPENEQLLLTEGVIRDLPSLTKLELVRNNLKAMPKLEALPNLTEFSMSDNKIQIVPAQAFYQLMALKVLDLSQNEIHTLNPIQAEALEKLNLNSNKIMALNATTFQYLLNLKKLSLSKNQIRFIDPAAFESLGRLEEMDLSYNQITFSNGIHDQSPIRRCENLRTLDISYNELGYIPGDFLLFRNLSTINMSYNKLTYFESTSLSFWHRNVSLSLAHNLIEKVDLNNLEILIDVTIYDQLTVDFDGNPIVCDCTILAMKLLSYKNIEIKTDNVFCNGPSQPMNLTDMKLSSVAPEDLKCKVNESVGCPQPCECWRQPYGNGNSSALITVDCRRRLELADDLLNLPKVDQLKVRSYPPDYKVYDVVLDLSENNITSVPEDYMRGLSPLLRTVDLRRNRLHSLQFLSVTSGNNRTRFNLSENLFSCEDCPFICFREVNYRGLLTANF